MSNSLERIEFSSSECCMGTVLVATSVSGICAIYIGDTHQKLRQALGRAFPRTFLSPANNSCIADEICKFIDEPTVRLNRKLDARGTVFQRRVWDHLSSIPMGQTRTYQEVAADLGKKYAVRAVARACAANNLAVAIPCHRIERKDGRLTGYRWGLERKKKLMSLERAACATEKATDGEDYRLKTAHK
ncbi:6-O-methylguanine DNA methyltransferase [Dipodascopsis tothii]|uniref:6-O-methylguanine DNA methyltransferase n=1 Tax=Dipodascopsis tothii TaxID=44089 RepID=UPI0034CED3F3